MSEREFDLSERAEDIGWELRRDDDGCYWLDFSCDPSFRSIGPLDLDEIEYHIVAAGCGMNTKELEEFCADQRPPVGIY